MIKQIPLNFFMYLENVHFKSLLKKCALIFISVAIALSFVSFCNAEETSQNVDDLSITNDIDPISAETVPALKTFGQDLGRDFYELFSSKNAKPLLLLGSAAAATFTLDQKTREVFENGSHAGVFSNVGHQLGKPYTVGGSLGAIYLVGLTTGNQKLKLVSYDLLRGYVIETAVVMSLKHAVGRQRPDGSDNLSFPSGHSATAFLWATVLNHHYGPKVGIPAYLGATYIATSRMKKDVHYLSDVAAGAAIGYLIARTVTGNQKKDQKLLWMPTITRMQHGGLNLEISFIF